jgi:hypothetical protein
MAVPANTQVTTATIGLREDLENQIYKVTANKVPFTNSIGDSGVSQPFHEWETYTQRAATTNANEQGDDTAATASEQPVRVGNRTQIFKEAGSVAGTTDASNVAGQSKPMAWQKVQKAEIVATDIEFAFLQNQASVTYAPGTPGKLGGSLAWLTSNVSRGAGGSSGGFSGGTVAAATNGTQRPFTETLLKSVLASGFSNGAPNIRMGFVGAFNKQVFSSFTGIADIRTEVSGRNQAKIYAAADVYVSDFGEITVMPVQYGLTRDALFIDPEMWAVGTLRPMKTEPLAKTGDAERFQIVAEKTLICRNQRGNAVCSDLATS